MADEPDYSGSAMIACYPPTEVADRLAVDGGLTPRKMHLTVAYVGTAADVDLADLLAAAASCITRDPIDAQVSGHARFTGGEQDVVVALADSPAIEALRRDAVDALRQRGVPLPSEHGYCPHLTISYLAPDDPSPVDRLDPLPVRFDTLSVVHGETRIDLPFTPPKPKTDPHARAAREAFAAGWADSGGPMTERVKAACAAAVDLAVQHPGDPHILEAALHLGRLEGVWATLYQRREQLIADHAATTGHAWKSLIRRENVVDAVADFQRRTAPRESSADDRQRQDEIKSAALAAAAQMLQALPDDPERRILRARLREALAAGRAEGAVGAVAIAAERIGQLGLDWDIAFDHAYAALGDLETLWADADGWLAKMLERATGDLGRALAAGTRDGATYAQLLAGAMDALDGEDASAVSFVVDWALSTGLSQGALDLYTSEGVASVEWITAGDGRVCPTCESNGEDGPYPPSRFPGQPDHPRCRCASAASFDLANYADWFTAS